jgi:magnesium transporter
MDRDELVAAAGSLDADDLAEIADDLPDEVVEQVRRQLTPQERDQLRAAMSFPEHCVGARMDFDLVTVREDVSLEVVLRYLRRFDALPDHTDQVFVVDRRDVFKGALPLDRLLVSEPDAQVAQVMRRDVLSLQALDQAADAAQAFERYDLISAPVLDARGRLIGRLTVDEVVDVIRERAEADVLGAAGLREEEDLFASIWNSARNRWLWLAVNLCTAFFASRVIGAFEGTIEKVVALAALMPIVAGIAGNSGNQTMTLFIRSLALGQVTAGNAWRLFRKELVIALLNGAVWGGVAGAFAWLLYRDTAEGMTLGATMMLAMVLNLLLAAVVAMAVPLMLQRIGRDPALGSSVLLTFTTDSMGFLIFLGLASIFFG